MILGSVLEFYYNFSGYDFQIRSTLAERILFTRCGQGRNDLSSEGILDSLFWHLDSVIESMHVRP